MTIKLNPQQEQAVRHAIESGLVRSVDEFVDKAVAELARGSGAFDAAGRRDAVRRMQQFGERHQLSLGEPVTRRLVHEGHRY